MRAARLSSIATAAAANREPTDCNEQIDGDGFGFPLAADQTASVSSAAATQQITQLEQRVRSHAETELRRWYLHAAAAFTWFASVGFCGA